MKTLKFDHELAKSILDGEKTSTWRLYDDKDLSVNDDIKIVDKVNPKDSKTWQVIGQGKVTEIAEKKLDSVTQDDMEGHQVYASKDEMLRHYRDYYGERVNLETPVKIVMFDFVPSLGEEPSAAMLLEEANPNSW